MNPLNSIVSAFTIEEQQKFIKFLESKNKRGDTKNVQLFNLLLKTDMSSKAICLKLYGSEKRDAYHALRKRLHESVIEFTANQSLQNENSVEMQIIKYILASRSFLIQKQYSEAYNILNKAELIASEHHMFPLLNEIYHTKIQYAYVYPSANLDALIAVFKNNQMNLQLEDELNIVYAKIRMTLNTMEYKAETLDFQTILQNAFKEHNIKMNDALSFKSLYQLVSIASISAFVTKDYLKIEPFLIESYNTLQQHKKSKKQLYYHIIILYSIANTLFRNKKFNQSKDFLDLMLNHMNLNNKKYYKSFILKYKLLFALNLNYNNQQELAIKTLENVNTKRVTDLENVLDIRLSLIVFYFQKGAFKNAHKVLSKFYHTDSWYTEKAGKEWVIKKNLIEILLHLELHNIDLFESRLLSFKRNYFTYLKEIKQQRVITYLSFVEMYYKNPETVTSEAFKAKVEKSFDWLETHKEDIFVISFYSWLKGKMNQTDLYATTMNLINQAQKESRTA
jgi:hypothetical protein